MTRPRRQAPSRAGSPRRSLAAAAVLSVVGLLAGLALAPLPQPGGVAPFAAASGPRTRRGARPQGRIGCRGADGLARVVRRDHRHADARRRRHERRLGQARARRGRLAGDRGERHLHDALDAPGERRRQLVEPQQPAEQRAGVGRRIRPRQLPDPRRGRVLRRREPAVGSLPRRRCGTRARRLGGCTAQAIWASAWASSHYGYGTHWSSRPYEVIEAPASAWGR